MQYITTMNKIPPIISSIVSIKSLLEKVLVKNDTYYCHYDCYTTDYTSKSKQSHVLRVEALYKCDEERENSSQKYYEVVHFVCFLSRTGVLQQIFEFYASFFFIFFEFYAKNLHFYEKNVNNRRKYAELRRTRRT